MTVEWLQFIMGCLVFVGGCLGVALRIGYIVASTINKITLETDAKVGRVYDRLDAFKEAMKSEFVRRESCSLMHNATASALTAAANASEDAIRELKVAVERLNTKVDALLMRGKE